jgi:hypothetical protein
VPVFLYLSILMCSLLDHWLRCFNGSSLYSLANIWVLHFELLEHLKT